ncbi:hypothetical protein JRQ81_007569 [Phrynocephalus forsythii]|uniref:GIY-YIG domain-containing protein n=1 Tax=Phrynocephalus forsythii TaxID=171643 RepID=A0A9Q0XC23_9SAUR|nr:hypothetical protein JRQ81_007569 [Phrynocephalus forsythii]
MGVLYFARVLKRVLIWEVPLFLCSFVICCVANILRNPKDKIELENQGVYEIPCKVCPATYIGQTNRRISARIAEHKNAVKKEEKSSSLFQHIKTTGHEIDFERTKLISKTEHFNSRIIMEAIEIEKHPNNMNKRDDTSRLPDI